MKPYKYIPPVLLVCSVLGITVARNIEKPDGYLADSAILMNTVVEVKIWGKGRVPVEAAAESAFSAVRAVDDLLGDAVVDIGLDTTVVRSDDFRRLVEISGRAYEVSEGRFDPTVGAVSRLWQFWDGAQPPAQDSIQAALRRVGFSRYAAGERPSGMLMDLGGVAKGYAADRAAAKLRALGFRSAIINAGGDMRLLGSRPDGKPWRIAIRHPRRQSDFIGFLDLEDISVATSGDYEKFFMYNGKRYHHILDPETGMPGYASAAVTVVAKDAALCDALATGLFLLGPEKGLAVVEAIDGVDAVFVHPDGETVSVSSGLGSRFGGLGAD